MEDLSKQFLSVCGIPGLTNVVVDRSEDPEDDSKTILDYFEENVQDLGDQTFLTQPMGNDEILTWTYSDVFEEAKKVAGYIESLNLPVRSQIAICSKNCAWWVIADLGIYMSNNVSVPVFPTLTAETTKYTLEHSESKLLFVGKLDEKPWEEQRQGIPDGLSTVSFPLCPENAAEKTWKDTVTVAEPIENPTKPTPETMATIIYTSGSTGM
jgi:long-chain acyl-CoA synthetase